MREIDPSTWRRRQHFELFNTFNHPHFSLCANLELTAFDAYVRRLGGVFTVALVYAIARVANAVPEFRQRIRAGRVVEHEVVSPSFTLLVDDDLFAFCMLPYTQDYTEFAHRAAPIMDHVRDHPSLEDEPGRDDLLYMTALPWVSFTSFTHPMAFHPSDSIPRFAWGKVFREGDSLKIPLSVQGHHALMDGIHMARFYADLEACLQHPDAALGP
jgi:chloramphenicol O-acetyltransferase type A